MSKNIKLPVADGGGLRSNAAKIKIELLPAEWTWGPADVMTKGSYKYDERNWERGMKWSTMIGCASRHVLKFLMGERYDDETGCHHLFMAAWNLMALASYDMRGLGESDLPFAPEPMKAPKDGMEVLDRVNNGNPTNPKIREAMGLAPLKEAA